MLNYHKTLNFMRQFLKRLCTIILLGICINIKLHLCMQVLGLSVCIHAFHHRKVLIPYNPFLFFLLPSQFTQTNMYHHNFPQNYMRARDFAIFFVMQQISIHLLKTCYNIVDMTTISNQGYDSMDFLKKKKKKGYDSMEVSRLFCE